MKKSDLETLKKMLDGTEYEVCNVSPYDNDKFFVVQKKEKVKVDLLTAAFGRIPRFQFDIHNGQVSSDNVFAAGKFLANELEHYLNKKS